MSAGFRDTPRQRPAFQILESLEADFEKMTWTFGLGSNTEVGAGQYAILPSDAFMKMSARLANAEVLLRRFLAGESGDKFKEHVEAHFDPEPL